MKPLTHTSTIALSGLLLLMAGCATSPPATAPMPQTAPPPAATAPAQAAAQKDAARRAEFDAALSRWHGAPVAELKTKLGKPSAVTPRNDGNTVYAYTRAAATNPGTGYSRFSCTVSYVVNDKTQRVQSHSMTGC